MNSLDLEEKLLCAHLTNYNKIIMKLEPQIPVPATYIRHWVSVGWHMQGTPEPTVAPHI